MEKKEASDHFPIITMILRGINLKSLSHSSFIELNLLQGSFNLAVVVKVLVDIKLERPGDSANEV